MEGGEGRGSKGCGKIWKLRLGTAEREMVPGEDHWGIAEKKKGREEVCLEESREISPRDKNRGSQGARVAYHRATEADFHRGTTGKGWVGNEIHPNGKG